MCGEGLPFPQDLSPTQTLLPSNYSHFSDLFTGSCVGLPDIGKEKGSKQGRQRLQYLGLAMPGKRWMPQEVRDGFARGGLGGCLELEILEMLDT